MRVLYIDVNYKNSSTGDIVCNLKDCCNRDSNVSIVCYGRGPRIDDATSYKFGLDFETKLHAFLTRVTGYTGCYSYFSTKRLIRKIKEFKPDVIHIHELHAYFVNVKKLLNFIKKMNIPTVFTNHCEFLYTGKCGYGKDCIKYSKFCEKCPHLNDYPKSLIFDHTKHMFNTKKRIFSNWNNCIIVSPSYWMFSRTKLSFLNLKRNEIINNGIDTTLFKYEKEDAISDKKVVLSVAPDILSERKGGFEILKIAKQLPGIDFILIGCTQTHLDIKLPKNITLLPLMKKGDLIKYYNSADLFLITSKNENFPTTCLEAQCCGLNIVGYDVGGVKETIIDGQGKLSKYGDVDDVAKNICLFLEKKNDKEVVSKKSIEYYSFDSMYKKYAIIYNEILKKDRK